MTGSGPHYNAPSVRYPVAGGMWLGGMLVLWSLAGALVAFLWVWLGAAALSYKVAGAALVLWGLPCFIAWHFWVSLPCGFLVWDGHAWTLDAAQHGPVSGMVAVHLDLQRRMGLCLTPASGKALWLWLEQRSAPERWSDVRRALYSRPRPGPADDGNHAPQRDRAV